MNGKPPLSDNELHEQLARYLNLTNNIDVPRGIQEITAMQLSSHRSLWKSLATGGLVAAAAAATIVAGLAAHRPFNPQPAVAPTARTSTPTTATPSHITLSGALSGELRDVHASCGLQEVVKGAPPAPISVSAGGTLNGHEVSIIVFDPSGPGSFGSNGHVVVTEVIAWSHSPWGRADPVSGIATRSGTATLYSGWFLHPPTGVSAFSVDHGATVNTTVPPDRFGSSGPDTTPRSPLVVRGTISC